MLCYIMLLSYCVRCYPVPYKAIRRRTNVWTRLNAEFINLFMYRSQWLLFDFLSFFSKPILHVSREVNSDTPLVLFYRICFAWIKSVFLNTILVLYNFNPTCTAVPVFLGLPSFHFAISSSLCRASMYQWCAAKFLYWTCYKSLEQSAANC